MTAAVMAPAFWLKLWASTLAAPAEATFTAPPLTVRVKGAMSASTRALP